MGVAASVRKVGRPVFWAGLVALCILAAWHAVAAAHGAACIDRRQSWPALPNAPRAAPSETSTSHFGLELRDEFAWLKADNWPEAIKDPAKLPRPIRAYVDAENRYAERSLAPLKPLRATLLREMRGRMEAAWSSVPVEDGAWVYFERHTAGAEHPTYWRRPRQGGRAQLMLDVSRLAHGTPGFELAGVRHSPDHLTLAFVADATGTEDFTLRFRDFATGRDLPDVISAVEDLPVWFADGRSVLYARRENGRAQTILHHRLGTPVASDTIVYRETDPAFLLSLKQTTSRRYILIIGESSRTNEIRALDALRPDDPAQMLISRREGERHEVEHHGDRFLIRTNSGGARDFRVIEAPTGDPDRARWREIVPHKLGTAIAGIRVTARHLVRHERAGGQSRIVVRRLADGAEHTLDFGREPHALTLATDGEFETGTLRLTRQTMRRPAQVFDYDLEARRFRLRRTQAVPSGHRISRYVTQRIHAVAGDGARIPILLLHARGLERNGCAPLLLHGYGAYGMATDATFDPNVLSLVDRGFVYAIAHVRGGGELDEAWRADGMGERKRNSFHDFIAAAEHLARVGYTARGRIIARGHSAGGLLVAGSANLRPDLFRGVIAESPFVDVVNTLLDKSLPLTPTEWDEWGDPRRSRADLETLLAYSPYDNVVRRSYPSMLVTGSLTDPRVTYWEPAKLVARLRARKQDRNPLLLVMETAAGHDGPTGRFEALSSTARAYAFALRLVARPPRQPASRRHR